MTGVCERIGTPYNICCSTAGRTEQWQARGEGARVQIARDQKRLAGDQDRSVYGCCGLSNTT